MTNFAKAKGSSEARVINIIDRVVIDWYDLKSVTAYCKRLGKGHMVIKYDNRRNYNICHKHRYERWSLPTVDVLFESE